MHFVGGFFVFLTNLSKMKRRTFIKSILSTGILIQIPWCFSCSDNHKISLSKQEVLNSKQRDLLLFVLQKLFPSDNNAPGIYQLNTYNHINNFLSDSNVDNDEKNYLLKGIQWTAETSTEVFKLDFNQLNNEQKNKLFDNILNEDWGESWLSRLLSLVFESLLLDPIYDVNNNMIGWKFLEHKPGKPRPNMQNKYEKLLAKKQKTSIITNLSQI